MNLVYQTKNYRSDFTTCRVAVRINVSNRKKKKSRSISFESTNDKFRTFQKLQSFADFLIHHSFV